jgi:pimeloyl-ACP methyl ester carboxylesterase
MAKRTLIAVALFVSAAGAAQAQNIAGDWLGTLRAGPTELRLVLHVVKGDDGGLKATLDSIDQGANGIPVTTVSLKDSNLIFTVAAVRGSYEGKVNPDGMIIDGTWSQNGASLALVLKRVKSVAELKQRRPQNPVKPYPYREEDVAYKNDAAGITFAATLTIPPGKGPFPAVLLITGSGPQDRDESLLGHRPFLVVSDYLTRRGIIVLRADDRGVGKSGGNFADATTADFATDAEAGVAYLKTRPEADPRKIGLIGHSEGGLIAPMVAARNPGVAFIVMMAGTGVPGDEVIVAQRLLISQVGGMSREQAEKNATEEREILALVKQEKSDAVLEKKLRERMAGKIPQAQIGMYIKLMSARWFRYFIAYDPAIALKQVTCPVLAINGEKDLQVPPKQNVPAIRNALEAAGNKHFEVEELAGLNHLFQTAKTGAPSEYGQIEETMSPVALERIARWVLRQ